MKGPLIGGFALLLSGCLQGNISGSTGVFGSNGATTFAGGVSSAGSGGAGSSGGNRTSSGVSSSSATVGATAMGASGSAAGGTTGGGTTGGTSGGCLALGELCGGNSDCCSNACNGICGQGAGQQCLRGADCTSANCVDGACACAASTQQNTGDGNLIWVSGVCASGADCCNGVSCLTESSAGTEIGTCCNQVGGGCQNPGDCCAGNCVDGGCACLVLHDFGCQLNSDCCTGVCSQEHLPGGGYCVAGAGQQCGTAYDCQTGNCVDGTCGTCSVSGEYNGFCASSDDCCPGLICGTRPDYYGSNPYQLENLQQCCWPNGATCDPSPDNIDGGYCCGACLDSGVCSCFGIGHYCQTDEGCCSGATCLGGAFGFFDGLACCQNNGQECFLDGDCCSGNCQGEQCACVPRGQPCGPIGDLSQSGPAACCSGQCSPAGNCL